MEKQSESLRILSEDTQVCADGLSKDEALGLSVSERRVPVTLRLYRYEPCVIVGRYQNLVDAIDLEACERNGYAWNRRHTGGGTVMMGPEQVAIGLAAPNSAPWVGQTIRRCFEFFAGFVARGLSRFGITAEFAGKNDLQVDGRKIAGLAISQDTPGGTFFHGSLLLDFDIERMVNLLNLPTRRLSDRGLSCFTERMTTVREHAPEASFEPIKKALAEALGSELRMGAEVGSWSPLELETAARLRRDRYENESWIYSSRVIRRWSGRSETRTSGGTLHVFLDRTGPVLDAVLITGDYFCRTREVARLEARLKGAPANREAISSAVGESSIYRVSRNDLVTAILDALADTSKVT